MRAYATIKPHFWTRGTGKRLRGCPEAQVVALYLMSCSESTMTGIFNMSMASLCGGTGLDLEGASKGLGRCLEEAFCFFDEECDLVFVPGLALHQVGESLGEGKNGKPDNKIAGIWKGLRMFRGHRFVDLFLERYAESYTMFHPALERHWRGFEAPSHQKPLLSPSEGAHVTDTDTVPDLETDRDQPDRSEGCGRPGDIPCPADLELTPDQIANVKMGGGVPDYAIDWVTARYRAKCDGAPPRTLARWRSGLVTAVMGSWQDAPKPNDGLTEPERRKRERQDAATEARIAADRQRLIKDGKRAQRGNQAPGNVKSLIAGIGKP